MYNMIVKVGRVYQACTQSNPRTAFVVVTVTVPASPNLRGHSTDEIEDSDRDTKKSFNLMIENIWGGKGRGGGASLFACLIAILN